MRWPIKLEQRLPSKATDRAKASRWFASALLVVMALLFLAARQLGQTQPAWNWMRAFAEAGLVGGLADWFAVTALFRHPLGLPIPHTAIIPSNKDRIAQSMASFLRANFLTAAVVTRRLGGIDLAGALGSFLAERKSTTAPRLTAGASQLLADLLHSLPGEYLGQSLKSALRGQLQKLDLAPLLGQLLAASMADGRHQPLIEAMLRWTGETLEANEDLLRAMIHERANSILRWTGFDETLANAILDGLYKLLAETIVNPDHPLRTKLEEMLLGLAQDLKADPETQAKVARMNESVLANPAMGAWIDGLWERAKSALLRSADATDGAAGGLLGGKLGHALAGFGQALQNDARLRLTVNRFARRSLAGIAVRYGESIVRLVSDTVKRWDARTVTERIESAVGRDLQFIRINGTLVGGLVGLALHAIDGAL